MPSSSAGSVVIHVDRLGVSTRVHARAVAVSIAVAAVAAGVFAWSITVGDFPIPVTDVLSYLTGRGTEDADFIIGTLRLPRGLTALLVGAAFGLSGAIFQRIARNPLASPTSSASTPAPPPLRCSPSSWSAALRCRSPSEPSSAPPPLPWPSTPSPTARASPGYRLVLVGIGITAMLSSVTSFLLTRAEIFDAQRATVWLTGSLNARSWDHVGPVAVALLLLVPAAIGLARHLRLLEMGDDAARGLGTRVELARGGLLLTGVALAAVSTASAGPVAFVALVAPQIARRLTGGRTLALVPAAMCGALLLVGSDLVARRLFAPTELPVGVFTAILGAPYLLYLLARANRIGSGG